jgi:hypothetical protein
MFSAQRVRTAVNLGFLDRSRYLFIQVVPQLSSRGWMAPFLRKSGSAGNSTWDLWVRSQELWPLYNRGGHFICHNVDGIFVSLLGVLPDPEDTCIRMLARKVGLSVRTAGSGKETRRWHHYTNLETFAFYCWALSKTLQTRIPCSVCVWLHNLNGMFNNDV